MKKPSSINHSVLFKWILAGMMLVSMGSNYWVQGRMNKSRLDLGLTRMDPLENAPPILAFSSVALGGFRGLIANALWFRVTKLQDEGRFFETLSLANWITKLQPTFSSVWTFQSWNLVYNISKQFEDPEERWKWIESAVQLLRDEALLYNPESSEVYRELAWIFQDKIGGTFDTQHLFYKARWAGEIRKLIGNHPDLEAIAASTDPEVIAKRKALKDKFGLEVERMVMIQSSLGPFDWRLPETYAIYWAWVGLENATEGKLNFLRRVIWQSMSLAFERGRILENQADQTIEYAPNLALAPYMHAMFKKVREEEDDPNYYSTIDRAHKEFLTDATYYFYLHNRLRESTEWFKQLKASFPDAPGASTSLEEFALNRLESNLSKANMNQTRLIINGLIRQFLYYLALGDEEQALGYRNLSELAWRKHEERVIKFKNEGRLSLPPYGELLKEMVDRVIKGEEGFSPNMILQLRTRVEFTERSENQ